MFRVPFLIHGFVNICPSRYAFYRVYLGRRLGYFIFSLIGLKRTLFTKYFSEALKGQLVMEGLRLRGLEDE